MSRRLVALAVAVCAVGALATTSIASTHGSDHKPRHKPVSAWDREWLMMSIQGDRFEIAGGQLALHKSSNPKVRTLAAVLIADHTKSLQSAVELAHRLRIPVPQSPSPVQQWILKTISRFSGTEFDKAYTDLEAQDHIQDIQEATDEVEYGSNRQVVHEAKSELPVLRKHLALAREALAAVGGNG